MWQFTSAFDPIIWSDPNYYKKKPNKLWTIRALNVKTISDTKLYLQMRDRWTVDACTGTLIDGK